MLTTGRSVWRADLLELKLPQEVYDNRHKIFNPTKFNAIEWMKTFKAAGATLLRRGRANNHLFNGLDSSNSSSGTCGLCWVE